MRIAESLHIVDMIGTPTVGEAAGQWALDFAEVVFGSLDPDTGRRLINEYFVLVPKKSWKSGTAATIMLTLLLANTRKSAEMVILAPTKEVADNAYEPASDMAKFDPRMGRHLRVQDHIRTITNKNTGATLKVVAADDKSVGGIKASYILVDELHLFGKNPKAEGMLLEATGGLASRVEGFVMYLTTQSDEQPAGVFDRQLNYARDVRDGKIHDPNYLPLLYEFPPSMIEKGEHLNPDNFSMVSPNFGKSVDADFLHRGLTKAKEDKATLTGWLAKYLNVQVGTAQRHDNWAGAEFWDKCAGQVTYQQLLERSEVIVVGIDGGGLDDLLGLCIAGRDKDSGKWLYWCHAWAHSIVMERRKDIAPRLQGFAKDGNLTIVDQPGDDVSELCAYIIEAAQAGLLAESKGIGVDAAGIGAIVEALTEEDTSITMDDIVAIGQGWKLNGAIKTLERKLAAKEVEHGGTALMQWVVGNARTVPVGNAIRIDKQVSGSAKIDPLMAALNATQLLMIKPSARLKKYQMFFV